MIDGVKNWITGVIALSFALSLAERLVTGAGVRRIWNLAGGMILTLVILSPLLELRDTDWELSFADYVTETAALEEELRESNEDQISSVIGDELEAYIWDKANALGLAGEIQVSVSGADEGYLPTEVSLGMSFDQQLSDVISRDLGLGREQQRWQEE